MRPWRRPSILSSSMSTHQTSLPNSAKPAAVTRPTYPVPMTPIGSLSVCWLIKGRNRVSRARLLLEARQRPRDRQHLAARQRARERVRDPVHGPARPPRHQPDPAPVVVDHQLSAVDRPDGVGVVEDRRRLPRHALDAVVLADDALGDDEPVRLVLLAVL